MISQNDKDRITEAIRRAEAGTSGEIFCVVAHSATDYRLVPVAWAAAIALAVPWPLIHFTLWPASVIYFLQLAAFIAIAIALSQRSIRFRIVPRRAKHDRAHALAMRQFFAQGLHQTENRTGVLIFASLAERYAEIIADAGIAAKVEQEEWDRSMAGLLADIGQGRLTEGLAGAIGRAGSVLARHFPPRPRDRNELPNDLILL
jgi:putative membrane protein